MRFDPQFLCEHGETSGEVCTTIFSEYEDCAYFLLTNGAVNKFVGEQSVERLRQFSSSKEPVDGLSERLGTMEYLRMKHGLSITLAWHDSVNDVQQIYKSSKIIAAFIVLGGVIVGFIVGKVICCF